MILALILYIQPELWENSGDFRVVKSISSGVRYIYIAGSGIARYDKLFSKWETPYSRASFPSNVKLIAQDVYTNDIWFIGEEDLDNVLCRYNPVFKDYSIFKFNSSEACSIGISEKYIYVYLSGGRQCMQFDKLKDEWTGNNFFPGDVEWTPKNSPLEYSWLAPWYIMDKSLMQYKINCVALDGQWLWVGTEGCGIYKYDNMSHFVSEHYLSGIPGGEVITMFGYKDELWFSCSEGLVREKGQEYSYFTSNKMPNLLNSPGAAIAGNDEKIWVASQDGVSQYDKKAGIWINFTENELRNARALYATGLPDKKDELWVGTETGLAKLTKGIIEKVFDNIWINDITTGSGIVWVSTARGAFYKSDSTEWQRLDDPYKSLGFGVNKMLIDSCEVYFGTEQGLLIFNTHNKQWSRATHPTELPGDEVFAIAKYKEFLYIGTNNGLAICDKKRNLWDKYTETNSPLKGKVFCAIIWNRYIYLITQTGLVKLKTN